MVTKKQASMGDKPKVIVGGDDGHYATKIVTETGAMFSIPSRARVGRHLITLKDDDSDDMVFLKAMPEDVSFTVDERLTTFDDTRYKEFPKSAHSRVLLHKALLVAGLGGYDVSIVTGLPVDYYFLANGEVNNILIDAKIENLSKSVTCGNREMANIVQNRVAPEALAAYVDQLMEMDGTPTKFYESVNESMVGVIDIGGKTTDCAVVLPGGKTVDSNRSGSNDIGILQLNQIIGSKIQTLYDVENVASRMIESAILTGKIKVSGETHDVSKMVLMEKEKFAEQIIVGVKSKLGSGKDLDSVLFVGGGSIVMRDQLSKYFKHYQFAKDPEFANARGMFKIAKHFPSEEEE